MNLIAVDPGTTSGVVYVRDLNPALGMLKHVKNHHVAVEWVGNSTEQGALLLKMVLLVKPAVVIMEDFVLRLPAKSMKREGLDPVRVLAVADWVVGQRARIDLQQPSQAKGVITDERLKKWGLWIKGSTHKRDAMRHLLLWLMRFKDGKVTYADVPGLGYGE